MAQTKENLRAIIIKSAGHYLSEQDGEGDLYDAYLQLKDVADDGHDWHSASDYVVMWHPLENMTVKEVLDLIEGGVEENNDAPFFKGIDWSELRNQKRDLLEILNSTKDIPTKTQLESLTGILHLIDAIQDYAVDELEIIESIHVYDFEAEEERDDE
jgi:hypothetical protein